MTILKRRHGYDWDGPGEDKNDDVRGYRRNFQEITGQDGIVILDFWATWCRRAGSSRPCKRPLPRSIRDEAAIQQPPVVQYQQSDFGFVGSRCLSETADGITDGMQICFCTRGYPQRLPISLTVARAVHSLAQQNQGQLQRGHQSQT